MTSNCYLQTVSHKIHSSSAIHVNDVSYNYGKVRALECVNLQIAVGEIYGLLGPSGCGKTTLLKCIIGVIKPKNGTISVLGYHSNSSKRKIPGDEIGYMPQDIALNSEFTIRETIEYFGRIFGLSKETRRSRLEFLAKFLDLPDPDRRIEALSGGQKRRTSLAAALVHNPPLLILDEPTVGVDPLLRESIWNHLIKLTSKGEMTVILTTHYIEEARKANRVGLMRFGELLVEGTPYSLLTNYKAVTLEEVFLKVCQQPKHPKKVKKEMKIESQKKHEKRKIENEKKRKLGDNCNKIVALLQKGSIRLQRNPFAFIFQTLIPALQIALFCLCIGQNPQRLDIAVYNPDRNYSDIFLNNLNTLHINLHNYSSFNDAMYSVKKGKAWAALMFDANYSYYLSKRLEIWEKMDDEMLEKSQIHFYCDMTEYPIQALILTQVANATKAFIYEMLNQMKLSIPVSTAAKITKSILISDETNETFNATTDFDRNIATLNNTRSNERLNAVRDFLHFTHLFFANISEKMNSSAVEEKNHRNLSSVNRSDINENVNTAGDERTKQTNDDLQHLLDSILSTVFINRRSFAEPFVDIVNPPVYGSMEPSFRDFGAPGLILGIIYILAVGLTALAFITDRRGGILERSVIAGVNHFEILIAHLTIQLIIILLQTALLLVFVFVVFDIDVHGSIILVILLTILQGFTGMSFGFLISSFCHEEQLAILVIIGSFYPNIMLSGIFWPLEGMSPLLRYFSYLMPQTMAISALRSIIARGWGLEYCRVWLGFISSLVWAAIFNCGALFVFIAKR